MMRYHERVASLQVSLAAAALLMWAVLGAGCVASPLDGFQVNTRSQQIALRFVFPEGHADSYFTYYYNENQRLVERCCDSLSNPTYVATDPATGTPWMQWTNELTVRNEFWYLNPVGGGPKWKARLRFRSVKAGAQPQDMLGFAGNPDGTAHEATLSCLQGITSSWLLAAGYCTSGSYINIYASHD